MFGFGSSGPQQQSRADFSQQQQGSQSFGQNMNNFFSSIFNPSMGFMNPFQSSSQPQQQQQQQADSAFWQSNQSQQSSQPRHSNSQTFSSSQSFNINNNNVRSSNGNTNSNSQRQAHQRFPSSQSSQSSQQASSSSQQQPFSSRVPQQQAQQSSNRQSASQSSQQQQGQNRNSSNQQQQQVPPYSGSRNNQQQDPQPSFRSTRSNWKKSEEDSNSTSKKKEQPKENTGEYWKQKGNEIFKKGFIDTAIEYYTRAISIDSSRSIFFSNRGRCYKIKKDLQRAFEDAVLAIELDDTNLKGHLLCGQVLCEMGKYEQGYAKIENGIKKLTKGLTLCTSQAGDKKKQFEKEISVYIFRAKKLLYYKKNEEQKAKKTKLIENYSNYLDSLPSSSLSEEDKKQQFDDFVFTVGDPNKEKELIIPDYLCCKITLDLMVDPVTTEAGHTYEREVVENLFQKNGFIDPVTRNSVKQFLYPNLGVKQAVEDFLQENPWAFEHSYNENYMKIEF